MSWELLIEHYGYLVLYGGMFLEGEAVLIMGGLLAHRGDLDLIPVILVALLGAWSVDNTFFLLGRFRGRPILERKPLWKAKSVRVLALLNQHQNWLILGLRFFWGFRTVIPFMVGMSGVLTWKFTLLSAIGALIWAVVFGVLGYSIGNALQIFMAEMRQYEFLAAITIGVVGILGWTALLWSRRRKQRQMLTVKNPEGEQP